MKEPLVFTIVAGLLGIFAASIFVRQIRLACSGRTFAMKIRYKDEPYRLRIEARPGKSVVEETTINPWDLGPYQNLSQTGGPYWITWPWTWAESPLCKGGYEDGDYPWGPVVALMKERAERRVQERSSA